MSSAPETAPHARHRGATGARRPVRTTGGAAAMFVLGALALAAGCEPSRDLAVDLRTDLVAGIEFDEVRTALDAQDGPPVLRAVTGGPTIGERRRG